jgi:hypothetical protein
MLSLVEVRLTLVQRIGLVSALCFVVLYALAPGVRYILFYVVGSIACVLALVQFRTDQITNRRTFLVVGLLATGFVLTLLQYEIRTRMGLFGLLSGEAEFSLRNALSNRLMELGADQNWTLDGALRALENGLIEPLWGETYIMTFVLLIPRAIWPGKPGAHWAEVSYLASPVGNNNVAYSAIGELALNFTVWAIPFGMWLAGWVAGTWWHLFRKYRKDKRIVVLYAMSLIPCAFMVRGAFAPMFGGIMYPLVLVTSVLRLSSSRTPKAKRPS